ncbi:MAG: cyclic nucleotide-binding domain-containing protein [Xanthobacteraceae bacterium]|nr:MAG: cyclic nucleotide-binding domain-containing protein [Xanthobacteraceae bacterium]
MRHEDREAIAPLPLFEGIKEESLDRLLHGAFLQRFPSHVELTHEGEPADFLHLVVDGQIEVFSRYRDRETTVAVLGPGHTFILAAVILDRPYLKSARALEASRILMLPAETVRTTFDTDPAFARAIARQQALAYRGVVQELKNQKLRSSLERLANWLLRRDAETGSSSRFELPFDKKVLAARLGMAPEVLSRTFATLADYGVKVDGKIITLKSRPDLTKLARPTPLIDDPGI